MGADRGGGAVEALGLLLRDGVPTQGRELQGPEQGITTRRGQPAVQLAPAPKHAEAVEATGVLGALPLP
eukprot:10621498-Alexandrium_andersonii.AAC.1